MKVLIVADWHGSEIYAEVFKAGFESLGCETMRFSWKEYFHHYQYPDRYPTNNNAFASIYYRAQNKFLFGPEIKKINSDLVLSVEKFKPNLVFVYRGTHILPKTLKSIRAMGATVFGYNNDDPFSLRYPKYVWRHFIRGLKEYDHIFSYRWKNIEEYTSFGVKSVSLLRSYYTKERNFLINEDKDLRDHDVIFIGHFENDGRDDMLLSLLKLNYNVKVFGTGWNKSIKYEELVELNGPIHPVYDDYNLLLNSTKIALVFLSKLNRDTYTRRCFEIPAAGALMISEYTDDLNNLFSEGTDCDYFRNESELLKKVKFYLENKHILKEVANRGHKRVLSDGHEVIDRVEEVLNKYKELVD